MPWHRTWTVFAIALCLLLALMLMPSLEALRQSQQIYREVRTMQENYERSQRLLEGIARNMFLISITIRELLLDNSTQGDRAYLHRLTTGREELDRQIEPLKRLVDPRETDALQRLEKEVGAYWASIQPVLRWTPRQRAERATYFLRQEQRPTRQSVLAIAAEVGRLNTALYKQQSEQVNRSEEEFRRDVKRVIQFTAVAGLVITAASILRIRWLEARAREHHAHVERTGEELRKLSIRLRHAQEDERKEISRELHDEVGQKLTALRMELGGLDRLRTAPESESRARVREMKSLAEQSLRIIRDIAAGLRPSMLDDLGLAPAIQRHAREFSRRTGLPVSVQVGGALDQLSERHRTYIYRIVQESLTNCAKHSRAKHVEVSLRGEERQVELSVRDDGVGFDPARLPQAGLGLIGIEERVRELGGFMTIDSAPGKGTALTVTIRVNGAA